MPFKEDTLPFVEATLRANPCSPCCMTLLLFGAIAKTIAIIAFMY